MDNLASNKSHIPCQSWAGQNGWSTASTQGPLLNPLPSSQHLILGPSSSQRPPYDHLQESSQHCMSDLSAAHCSALYKASLISSDPPSNALFANTAVPSTSHRISFAQQTSHTSPMLLTANQGKNAPLLSLPQTNQAPQLCRPQLLPLPSHNHNLYKAPFQPPSSNQSLPNGLLPASLPSCGRHVSTSAAAFQGTNVAFSGVAGYTHSRASSTSQERSQWIPSPHCREAVTESIPDAAAHPKNKPSKEDTISPPANNERQRLVLLHQRAQLLQQVAELDKLLESIDPEESRDGRSPHSAIQSPPLMDDSAQCEQPKTSDAEQLQLSAGKSECQSHPSSDCSSPAYYDDQSEDDSVLTAESEKEEKDFGESSDESDPDFFPNSDGDFSDFLSDPDWDSSDESSHSSPAAVETPLPPDEKELKKEKTASPQRKICPTNPMNSFKTVVLPSLSSKMGRVYDRRNYCLFCTKPLSKMAPHLERIHSDKPEVAAVFQYPKYSKDRQKIWNRLINQGNFAHNKEVLKTGMGHLVSRKRPNTTQKAQDFLHCLYCRGLFIKKALYRHMKSCPEKVGKEDEPEVGRKRLALRCVLETLDDLGISDGFKDILSPMLFDDVTQTIMADEIILQYGEDLFIQHGSNPKKHDYIRQNLRQIARLLLEAQNTTPLKKLKDFFLPSSFPHVVSAVNDLAGYNPETKAYNHPSLAIKLGYNLQKTCGIVEGNAERCGDASAAESARSFLAVYQEKWNALVSAGALTSIRETKLEKEKKVPFAQDVKRLNSHMEDVHLRAEKKLRDATSAENYAALARVILARTVPLGPLNRVEMMITESELTESEPEPDKIETSVDDRNQTCPPLGHLNRVETCQKHHLVWTTISSLDSCIQCLGPVSSKWLGYECRVCSGVWHKSCLKRISNDNQDPSQFLDQISDECMSDEEYIPESETEDDDDSDASIHIKPSQLKARRIPVKPVLPNIGTSQGSDTSIPVVSSSSKGYPPVADHMVSNAAETSNSPKDSSKEKCKVELKQQVTHLTMTRKNYCYVCGKPQSKISRHLKTHNTHAEIIKAFSLPEHSKERKMLVEKMRNKGNFKHNTAVLQDGTGPLKVKRKPKAKALAGKFIHCMYCQGMYIRKELWRHARRCPFKPENAELNREPGRTKVLALAEAQENAFSQQISSGVWKILSVMKQDEVASFVRNDLSIINLAQSLYNKHGQDPTKYEYIRQKLREVGRLLLCLRTDFSVHNLEEAVKPANFQKVVQAVKRVSGFDEEKHSYATPSLALKLGHTLQKICDIVHCRALKAEDEELIKSTDMFKKLYTTKWSEVVSHCALNTLSDAKYNKPSTLPFTEDVQMLHRHLEKSAETAFSNLEKASTQNYAQLAKCTLAQIIVFNRRSAGEVSKMRLKSFHERDDTKLHKDVAMGLSKTEQRLCNYFSRIEIMGKRGRKVAVLLTPSMLDALSLLTSKRLDCGVCATNVFLFAIPNSMSHYRGQDCLRVHASKCGAKHPEYLRSTQLRKHVATLSQVLNLKNNELDQVADFLGHDIRVHRDFYRLPVPTTQLAKISKLLLSMEKGNLSSMQGKSLDEIEVEDEIALSDAEDEDSGSESDDGRSAGRASECGTSEPVDAASNSTFTKHVHDFEDSAGTVPSVSSTVNETAPLSEGKDAGSRRGTKTAWSKAEVAAVMRHFQSHIRKGHLATKNECSHCKLVEGPVLEQRTVQNVRDFVRNRGIAKKRQSQKL